MSTIDNSSADALRFYISSNAAASSTSVTSTEVRNRVAAGKFDPLQVSDNRIKRALDLSQSARRDGAHHTAESRTSQPDKRGSRGFDIALQARRGLRSSWLPNGFSSIKRYVDVKTTITDPAYNSVNLNTLYVNNNPMSETTPRRGISLMGGATNNMALYVARTSTAGSSWTGGNATTTPLSLTSWVSRFRMQAFDTTGWCFENANEDCLFAVSALSGNGWLKGTMTANALSAVGTISGATLSSSGNITASAGTVSAATVTSSGAVSAATQVGTPTLCVNTGSLQGGAYGISMYGSTPNPTWAHYLAQPGASRSWAGGTACSMGTINSFCHRFRCSALDTVGFIFENASETGLMSLNGASGDLLTAGAISAGTGFTTRPGSSGALGNNAFNLNWTANSGLEAYIDTSRIAILNSTKTFDAGSWTNPVMNLTGVTSGTSVISGTNVASRSPKIKLCLNGMATASAGTAKLTPYLRVGTSGTTYVAPVAGTVAYNLGNTYGPQQISMEAVFNVTEGTTYMAAINYNNGATADFSVNLNVVTMTFLTAYS